MVKWNRLMLAALKVIIKKLDIKDEIIAEYEISKDKWPDNSGIAPSFTEYVFGDIDKDKG